LAPDFQNLQKLFQNMQKLNVWHSGVVLFEKKLHIFAPVLLLLFNFTI